MIIYKKEMKPGNSIEVGCFLSIKKNIFDLTTKDGNMRGNPCRAGSRKC